MGEEAFFSFSLGTYDLRDHAVVPKEPKILGNSHASTVTFPNWTTLYPISSLYFPTVSTSKVKDFSLDRTNFMLAHEASLRGQQASGWDSLRFCSFPQCERLLCFPSLTHFYLHL